MDLVTTDVETYYDKEYSLRKMTPEEYIRDERFEFVGVTAKLNDQKTIALFTDNKKELREWYLDQFPLKAMWLGHNMSGFDSLVLTHHLDIHPKFWQCTLSMGRLLHGHMSVSLAEMAELYGLSEKGTYVTNMVGKRFSDLTPQEIDKYTAYGIQDTNLCYQLYQLMFPKIPAEELQLINLFTRMFAEPRLELDAPGLRMYLSELRAAQHRTLRNAAEAAGMTLESDSVFADGSLTEANLESIKKLLRSDKKFAALLESFGVEPPRKISPRTGKETYAFAKTDEAMKELLDHPNHNVSTLVAARMGVKTSIEQSRTERFIGIAERGKLPALFLYGKTHTNRAAGGGKINLQNMTRSKGIVLTGDNRTPKGTLVYTPDGAKYLRARNAATKQIATTDNEVYNAEDCTIYGLRHGLRAPDGYKVVVVDSSNIELRIAHTLAGQMDVVERIRQKEDMYCWFAGELYGYPVDKVNHPFERFHGKVGMLQLQYQSGWEGFLTAARGFGLKVSKPQADETVNVYRTLFPNIVEAWNRGETAIHAMHSGEEFSIDQWGLCVTEHNAIRLPNGTRMMFHDLRREAYVDKNGRERVGWAYTDKETRARRMLYGGKVFQGCCQALARIVVFEQMLEIERRWGKWTPEGMTTGVVLTAHDEVVTVVKEEDAEACLESKLEIMRTSPEWLPQLPLDAEGDIAQCYGAAK